MYNNKASTLYNMAGDTTHVRIDRDAQQKLKDIRNRLELRSLSAAVRWMYEFVQQHEER